jgi:LuxR family maltose regulon positive regulatory protein
VARLPAAGVLHVAMSEVLVERNDLEAAESCGRLGVAIELRILRSLALMRRGDTREAEADLERAFALAEPEGFVRIFLDEGQPMQMLLAQWLARAGAGPLRD